MEVKCNLLEKYTQMIRMKHYSPMTEKSYVYHLEKFFDFKNRTTVYNLSSQDINDYLVCLNDSDVSDSYFNQAINAIRFFFKYVLNKKIKDYLVVRPKKAKTQPILLSDNEMQSLFNACDNLKHKCILSLIASAGLRVSEIINLKIEDIDNECMIIRIRSAKGRKDRQCLLDRIVLEKLEEYMIKYNPPQILLLYLLCSSGINNIKSSIHLHCQIAFAKLDCLCKGLEVLFYGNYMRNLQNYISFK